MADYLEMIDKKNRLYNLLGQVENAYRTIGLQIQEELDRLEYADPSDYSEPEVQEEVIERIEKTEIALEEIKCGFNLLHLEYLNWRDPAEPPTEKNKYLVKLDYKARDGEGVKYAYDVFTFDPDDGGWHFGRHWFRDIVGWHPTTKMWAMENGNSD